MCGIAGFLSLEFDEAVVHDMTAAIKHRGPDAAGFFSDPAAHLALGHRRLSILDLSEAANQPFWTADRRYVMIYNGEVYNFREIAENLDLSPRTSSDTEVIIEGFARIGTEIFARMNGMFAIAIWDTREKVLTLARDRIGIKPLFVAQTEHGLLFASEIKAMLRARRFEVNYNAIPHFLYLGYLPQEESLFDRIEKFPAGHYGSVRLNGPLSTTPFWKAADALQEPLHAPASLEEAKKQLHDLIASSVRYRMISDVPLGTFLSGGTDSSTVTAIAQEISPHPVKTFSIGFREASFNESDYARQVAGHLGTEHHEYILSEQQALEVFNDVLDVFDEPFADSSSIPTMLVSEIARKHVTVALSGDGGDELFMGYGMYRWAQRLRRPGVQLGRGWMAAGLNLGNNRAKRAAHLFRWKDRSRLKSHIFSQEQYYFSERELESLLKVNGRPLISIDEQDPGGRKMTPKEAQAFFDINNYLKDDLLVKVDRASMRYSLEVRVPLLDHRLVEFALRLPEHWKVRGGTEKFLLKEVLYDLVPREFFQRPKWGFGIPLAKWLQTDLKYLVDHHLRDELVDACGLVDPEVVRELKSRFFAGEAYLYNRIWVLLMLHKWFNKVTA